MHEGLRSSHTYLNSVVSYCYNVRQNWMVILDYFGTCHKLIPVWQWQWWAI